MTTYTYAQLEQLWINAGGPAAQAPIAAAIAEAESSGNSAATNPNDNNGTQTSWGLWQISNGTHGQPAANILDPTVNAQAAVAKYQASGWAPWGTYNSGAYTQFLANNVPPSSAGVPAATASTTAALTVVPGTCVVPYPTLNLVVTTVGGGCILSKSEARAMIGGLCIAAGALIALPGLIILVAAGFKASGAAGAIGQAAGPLAKVPGYGKILAAA
jgi:Lysozyme like domain